MPRNTSDHEKLFDEISGKLMELSEKSGREQKHDLWSERLEKMQENLRISQDELRATQTELQNKINSLDTMSFTQTDLTGELRKATDSLEQERQANSKLSSDLAKSLELNLKLQFDLEEIRTKANNLVGEERKLNQFLNDKNRALTTELDLSQALQNEIRLELMKAKDCFQGEAEAWTSLKKELEAKSEHQKTQLEQRDLWITERDEKIHAQEDKLRQQELALQELEKYALSQNEMMKSLSNVAEKKMIELKLGLDKKMIESQDYYSHLQQALNQIQVLRQENVALKDYIVKLSNLHQSRPPEMRA